ncbi:D-2-hydroxyglutarate dehydrogenase YdiJ [Plesiomonas sp.]|uniref:D-2-hydroxyglutarate dehydrogenase YdiJ n=1 Tax=Plesiomonas sp. TaxID=2486279 RepID=UPI003F416334
MIPRLSHVPGVAPVTHAFLDALKTHGFTGDAEHTYAARLSMATDNSVYQQLPQAVVFPRSVADMLLLMQTAQLADFKTLTFTPRGGGTGTNGQSLTTGIVVDTSRYMNRILELNLDEMWVRVESGVIKDQLNAYLRPHGYFFSPDLSTSNRATIGGMINTDASGQGSLLYGKTSDHVLGLRAVMVDGTLLDTAPMAVALAEHLAQQKERIGQVYQTVLGRCREQRALILERFPPLNRFLTGYDLKHVFNDDLSQFDLTRLLTGSEGSLALIAEAKLNITAIPHVRQLINIKYDSFDSALRHAPFMVQANALSVETVDSKVLNLAREDIVWHSVRELITDVPGVDMQGLNIVEFAGDDAVLIEQQINALCDKLDSLLPEHLSGVIGYQRCNDLVSIERIYTMRKKAVGLLGNTKGAAKPIAFAEDTCVPPEHLADYIAEFRTLLDQHGLHYGMFGHVDAGVLHVRPALDLCDPQQEILMKTLSDQVVALTAKYGGLMWGEHGKGFRSEYSPLFFGETLWNELRHIKTVFDPDNRLNPGKICIPLKADAQLVQVSDEKRSWHDKKIPLTVRESYRGALECNGNGLCFNFDTHSPMCPSVKITRDRRHSPKGRAALVREWLTLLADEGADTLAIEASLTGTRTTFRQLIAKTRYTLAARRGEYDFSHEVKEAMSGCLACKACSTQCPIKIDVPAFRSRFLQLYHTRYLRPVRDYMIGTVEQYAPLMAKAPRLFNALMQPMWMQHLTEKTLGMVDVPLLSVPTLPEQLTGHTALQFDYAQLQALSQAEKSRYLLVVQDPFTSFYDASVVADFIRLAEHLGFQPVLLPFKPNGKPQHVKGFLTGFANTATNTAEFLNHISALGIPLVGVDPALVLCYRDEYRITLGDKRGDFNVLLTHEWLKNQLAILPAYRKTSDTWYLFGHCTESTALPESSRDWASIFAHFGAELQAVSVGCCGMAGTYGHEKKNRTHSQGIYALSWQSQLKIRPLNRCVSTGYSCRSQVKREEKTAILHPAQALLAICRDGNLL